MNEKIIIAGSGGQGIMVVGRVLAEAALKENKEVTWLPAYGAEVRGGTANCTVIISDTEIGSPFIDQADSLIIMNALSLKRFIGRLKNQGLLVLNSSLAKPEANKKISLLSFPFSELAVKLGNIKVANIVALGAFIAKTQIVSAQSVIKVIEEMAQDKKALVEINKKALACGQALVKS